jgi:hypothetical protein
LLQGEVFFATPTGCSWVSEFRQRELNVVNHYVSNDPKKSSTLCAGEDLPSPLIFKEQLLKSIPMGMNGYQLMAHRIKRGPQILFFFFIHCPLAESYSRSV